MSGKSQFPFQFNWQSTNPQLTLFPLPANQTGSVPSGTTTGTMSGTSTIYSNIIDVSRMDNIALDVSWTGTPTGTLLILESSVFGSNTTNWPSLTFTYQQPAGAAGFEALCLNQIPFKFIMLSYTNISGSGVLSVSGQQKDVN